MASDTVLQRIAAALNGDGSAIAQAIWDAIRRIWTNLDLDRIETLIGEGDYDAVVRIINAESLRLGVIGVAGYSAGPRGTARPTAGVSPELTRIEALLSRAEPYLARTVLTAVQGLRDQLDLGAVADMIERGDFAELIQQFDDIGRQLGSANSVVFVQAGQSGTGYLNENLFLTSAFDQVNVSAVMAMQENNLRLIREFTESQRAVVREVVVHGIETGIGPRDQARNFRDVVGLTQRQARAVLNYRTALEQAGQSGVPRAQQAASLQRALRDKRGDASVQRAIRENKPLTPERVDWLVQRYYERSVKARAETIARTEALSSVNAGDKSSFDQAIEQGKISRDDIMEKWVSAGDKRVRDSHRHLNGKTQPYGQLWQGLYGVLRYPGDPNAVAAERINCRCVVTRRVRRGFGIGHNSQAMAA